MGRGWEDGGGRGNGSHTFALSSCSELEVQPPLSALSISDS